jgi:hypothetical protein
MHACQDGIRTRIEFLELQVTEHVCLRFFFLLNILQKHMIPCQMGYPFFLKHFFFFKIQYIYIVFLLLFF